MHNALTCYSATVAVHTGETTHRDCSDYLSLISDNGHESHTLHKDPITKHAEADE